MPTNVLPHSLTYTASPLLSGYCQTFAAHFPSIKLLETVIMAENSRTAHTIRKMFSVPDYYYHVFGADQHAACIFGSANGRPMDVSVASNSFLIISPIGSMLQINIHLSDSASTKRIWQRRVKLRKINHSVCGFVEIFLNFLIYGFSFAFYCSF